MPTSDYIIGEADVTVDTPDGVCITFKVSNAQIINEREILEHFSSRSGVRIRDNEVLLSSSSEFRAVVLERLMYFQKDTPQIKIR